jgi:hypothetical protein
MVMQFHHKKEVNLGEKGSPYQDSTQFATIFVTAQGCCDSLQITS